MKFYYLGNFDEIGKSSLINTDPTRDTTIGNLVPTINSLLPERKRVDQDPIRIKWLADNNIQVKANTEIVVTFVTEGAGYRNAVGYFIYDTDRPPLTIGQIKECYFFFPNASKTNSGGSMNEGDRIKLASQFSISGEIATPTSNVFSPGTSVGFIIYPNGWRGNGVNKWVVPYTSTSVHNPERDPEKKYHSLCIIIPGTTRLVLGFEDLRRDSSGCDHDFNDCVMIIDTDLGSVDGFVDTDAIANEANEHPNMPAEYKVGYKKLFTVINKYEYECVATLFIPSDATIIAKKGYVARLCTNKVYVKSIRIVAPIVKPLTPVSRTGELVNSAYSWYNNSFVYNVKSIVETDLIKEQNRGIHYFGAYSEAALYNFTPEYGL